MSVDQLSRVPLILPLSAKSDGALRRLASAYRHLLESDHKSVQRYENLLQLCMDAGTKRAHFNTSGSHHLAAVGRCASELKDSIEHKLLQLSTPLQAHSHTMGPPPEVAFLFTGQGAASLGMGRGLYERNAAFRAVMDECDAIMAPLLDGMSILRVCTTTASVFAWIDG